MRLPRAALGLAAFLLTSPILAAQDLNRTAGDRLAPSVVIVQNAEGYGSGMILQEKGLILTNAHVICSPLPFSVKAYGKVQNAERLLEFRRVTLLGVHPEYDLALLQIDPSEHGAVLKPVAIAPSAAVAGDPVWAMGYPSDVAGGTRMIQTGGKVRSTNRIVYGDPYIDMDVSVYFGNSGGPLCNGGGEVVGVVAMMNTEGGSMAVPIASVRAQDFVPLQQRRPNHSISASLIADAEKLVDMGKKGSAAAMMFASMLYEEALIYDSGNGSVYGRIGQFNFLSGRMQFAIAYYIRALQLSPWPEQGQTIYRQLGLALAKSGKEDAAFSIWEEGLAKYPQDNSVLWEEMAIIYSRVGKPFDAACSARTALKTFCENAQAMNSIYQKSREKLSPPELASLREFETDIPGILKKKQVESDKAKKEGKAYLFPEAEKVVNSFGGVQQSGKIDLAKLGLKRELEKLDVSDEELTALFIRSRVRAAGENLQGGKITLAVGILEDVIKAHPTHPETEDARELLRMINRKK